MHHMFKNKWNDFFQRSEARTLFVTLACVVVLNKQSCYQQQCTGSNDKVFFEKARSPLFTTVSSACSCICCLSVSLCVPLL